MQCRYFCWLSGALIACATAEPEMPSRGRDAVTAPIDGSSTVRSDSLGVARRGDLSPARESGSTLSIATFNIQAFGKTKAHNSKILEQLAAIVRRYDVVVIQEIKDISNQAPTLLLDAVNRGADSYAMLLSHRSGLQPDDLHSQESYAVYYDTATVQPLPGDRLYDDSERDQFQRDPYLTHLKSVRGSFSFVLIDIHTRPESAVSEIAGLVQVFQWAKLAFPGEANVIALGDFNAGCSYASSRQLDALAIRGSAFRWIVPDSSDSNVSPASACAYDRIVTTASAHAAFTGRWGVDATFNDKKISDHWPVWAEFAVGERLPGTPSRALDDAIMGGLR
jgi:endonuclease/exonuclease/phosphatase family metal-dependent hydrolase